MKFTKIPTTTFQKLVLNAGVILAEFDPASPASEPDDSKILSKTDRDKAMAAIRDYYDKYPTNHVIDARYLQQRFDFSEVYAAEVIRVLVASDLITYDPEPGGPEPYIRLKPKGQVYA